MDIQDFLLNGLDKTLFCSDFLDKSDFEKISFLKRMILTTQDAIVNMSKCDDRYCALFDKTFNQFGEILNTLNGGDV